MITEFLKWLFSIAVGFLGEQIFSWFCQLLNKNNIKWHLITLFKLFFRKLPVSFFIGITSYYIWFEYKDKINELVMMNHRFWFIPFQYILLSFQVLFFFCITLFFLVGNEYLKEIEKKRKITHDFKQLSEGKQLKDAIFDLTEKIVLSECVLSGLINEIPGAVILVDRLFNIVLCNNEYRDFCRDNFRVVGLGKSVFYNFQEFHPYLRFQKHIFSTFENNVKSEDVLIIYEKGKKIIEFNTVFLPIKNGSVLMVMVILRKKDATGL